MTLSAHSQVAIVTGAGRGAGRAIARRLAMGRWSVVLTARTAHDLDTEVAAIQAAGGVALGVPADVGEPAAVTALVEQTLAHYGRVDALINNAGIGLRKPVGEITPEEWDAVFATNTRGVFLCSQAVLPAMRAQGGGHIISIGSGAGKQGYAHLAAYCASKFALIGFSEALAAEVSEQNIKVTVLNPGTIDTDWAGAREPDPERKLLQPEDVAEAVVYLLSQPPRAWTAEMNLWPFR